MITVERIQASVPDVDATKAAAILERIQLMKSGKLLETLAKPRQGHGGAVTRVMPAAVVPRERKPCCQRGKPGNELAALLKSLGIDSKMCSTGCGGFAATMNAWGVEGCRTHRAEIVQRLEQQRNAVDWMTQATVAAKMLTTGVYLMVNPLDPLGSLVDIAIMRAEKCESGACEA